MLLFVNRLLAIAAAWVLVSPALCSAAHTRASLILAADTAPPGSVVLAGVHLRMDENWHTYWQNPGAAGTATTIQWELPPGVTAGPMQWPLPEKLIDDDLTTYLYKNEVVLVVPLTLSTNVQPGKLELKAKVDWLECEVQCVPGGAEIKGSLNVGNVLVASKAAALIAAAQRTIPHPGGDLHARAYWKDPAPVNGKRNLVVEWTPTGPAENADFLPGVSEGFEILGPTERLSAPSGLIRIRKEVNLLEGSSPTQLSGVAVQGLPGQQQGFEVTTPIESSESPALASGPSSLWRMLIYALIGGLILNIMPCVLPVIALKILGFVGQSKEGYREVRKLGLIYCCGVLVSFLVLALLVIGVKAAGHKAGWGMQFGNPEFLVILTVIVTLVALNLFGLFEVTMSGRVMGVAGELSSKHGPAGAFFNGVLATVLATPCTAPFLGAALGFAFAQPAPTIILIFLTVGAGLALPYLVLSWEPAWLKFLPKPGAWMERFKIAMGFPMLATAIWLFSLLPIHYGERSWWLGVFLVIVAFSAWFLGEFVQRGRSRKSLALGIAAATLVIGYLGVLEGKLEWRSPTTLQIAALTPESSARGIAWQPWSPEAVTAARASGHPVLVDFTAKWCLTCNTVVKPALESQSVREKLKTLNFVPLLADYTLFPDNITVELNRFGRAGVPLVLVYPADKDAPPFVLPEALTPGMVVSYLEKTTAKPAPAQAAADR